MPFTLPEAIEDFPALFDLVNTIVAQVGGLPPVKTAKAYSDLLVTVLPKLSALIDTIEAQAKS